MKLLIIGANGMLGNACMNYFAAHPAFQVTGALRSQSSIELFKPQTRSHLIDGVNISDEGEQRSLFDSVQPEAVINCAGIVKQAVDGRDPQLSITLNSLLPHQLLNRCMEYGSRLLHISTDCVFSGVKGSPYNEADVADANDLYGRTKYLGEISDNQNALTLRTSYIGNELRGTNGLLEWFLSQEKECQGFTRAIYSGLPSIILVQVLEMVLLECPKLYGLYQVASSPISKYNLLQIIANTFKKHINIIPNDSLVINRSLNGSRFQDATGFIAPPWEEMIEQMYLDRIKYVSK